MVDADSDDIFGFINLSDTWPVFQLFFSAAFGADPLKDDKPHIYLDDFAARHEIRFQMPGAKQYSYDISSWVSTSLPPRDPHAVPRAGQHGLGRFGAAGPGLGPKAAVAAHRSRLEGGAARCGGALAPALHIQAVPEPGAPPPQATPS